MRPSSSPVRAAGVALGVLLLILATGTARVPALTSQNFQTPGGTAYEVSTGTSIAPSVMGGGPTVGSNFIRLLSAGGSAGTNSIAFERTDPGGFTQIVVNFDFRMNPVSGQGQGMGFALLNTAVYGKSGLLAGAAEEPNFTGSLGIGFDIHADGGDPNPNHVSVHFNSAPLTQVDAGAIALAGNQWIHAQIVIRPGGGFSDVSVTLTPQSTGIPVALISNYVVPGLEPYEGRAYFAARKSASDTADHDLANVHLVFTADPSILGQWSAILPLPIIPIHSALLPNGKIICWDRNADGTDTIPRLIDVATLDNPAGTVNVTPASHPGLEIFCSGHTLLSDGRLFVAGGHNMADGEGLDTAFIYDAFTNGWTPLPPMLTGGRWYPSVSLLSNGDPIVFSGDRTGPGQNPKVQIWQIGAGSWKTVGPDKTMLCYPYLHLAPNGMIFRSGPEPSTEYLDTTAGVWSSVASRVKGVRDFGSSVLYNTGKILILGGGAFEAGSNPTSSAEVIDLLAPTPSWRLVSPMAYARRQCNALLLPDGTVLVTGGTSNSGLGDPAGAVHAVELWDPITETFRTLAGMNFARMYHSETLLLPDGRAISLGSGHPVDPPGFNCEVFSPPYLFKGPRPALTAAPARAIYGEVFPVTTADAATVTAVSLIAATSVTHTNNFTQRIVHPAFSVGAGSVSITAPSDPNLCPPGLYLLFLLNAAGVPSQGKMILINYNRPPVAATGGNITAESVDATGATVQLDGTSSTDPDNNITTYEWFEGGNLLATGVSPMVTLTPGVHTITLKVTDGGSLTSTRTFTVTIQDTTAPNLQSLTVTPQLLRAVTNQLVPVTLQAVMTDTVDPSPTVQAFSVVSTEAPNGLFPGDLTPDWQITPGSMTLNLRAERHAIFRRYSVTAEAKDASGNTSTKSVDVKVRGKWFP